MDRYRGWSVNRIVAAVVGGVLVLVGLLGFFTGETLIVFGVNVLHNWVHLGSGALLLIGAFAAQAAARTMNFVVGGVYAVVTVLGFLGIVVPSLLNMSADAFPHADNMLHALLTIGLLATAFFADRHYEERRVARGRVA